MRSPQDVSSGAPRARSGRARWWLLAVIVLIVVLASLKSLATVYTDGLWFSSIGQHRVWSTLLGVKVGLFASFGAVFFVLLWVNLSLCDRLAARHEPQGPDDEVVRRYKRLVRPRAGRVHAVVAFLIALVGGAVAVGQWNNWLLFTHAQSFPTKDPQFGLNDGFFVFRLPFLQFLVDWVLAVLVVTLAVTVIFHYLNGGIRFQRGGQRVHPVVKVHLSVLLALVAVAKAAGYLLQRYSLDLSTNGYVEGAGYTDVHARLPALEVLIFISLFSAAILLYNIRRQGWTLPVLAIGLWAFVALVIGVIYPLVLQALRVNPSQSALEKPYIARNIAATRAAYDLNGVKVEKYQDSTTVSPAQVNADLTSLKNIRLWDPSQTVSVATFNKLQDLSAYYTMPSVSVTRYTVDKKLRPVIVGARQVNDTNLPSPGWVNSHLQYTHGEGMVVAPANEATAKGNPRFTISDVPPTSSPGFPKLKQSAVYFGVTLPGYVVAHTRQRELNGQTSTGTNVESRYAGNGGVRLNSFLTRAAFALRLGDLNLLISNLITPDSKIMFVRDVRAMAEKAAPFLSFDSQPYPALVDGHVDWLLNGYTTTANYPYSQNADTASVPPGSGLPASYNYVRNSVEVVVNAYTGKMSFYTLDESDPVLRAYSAAFPSLFKPATAMPRAIWNHLRYGQDVFAIQAALYGRYHIVSPSQFYSAGDAWVVAPTLGVGSPDQPLKIAYVLNAQGQVVSGSYEPMSPLYQVLAEPGSDKQSFTVTDAYVPAGNGSADTQVLRGMLMASSDRTTYGQLRVYETAPGASKKGPILADSEISATTNVSQQITLLDRSGSQVELGTTLVLPVGQSVIYIRPLYVESKTEPQPQLKDVIGVLGQNVVMRPTLDSMLNALLGTDLKVGNAASGTTPPSTSVVHKPPGAGSAAVAQARQDLAEAQNDYGLAQAALKNGKLGTYQAYVSQAQTLITKAEKLLGTASTAASSGSAATSPKSTGSATATATPPAGTTPGAKGTATAVVGPAPHEVAGLLQRPSAGAGSGAGGATALGASPATPTTTTPGET